MKIIDPAPIVVIMFFGLFFMVMSGVQPELAFIFVGLLAATIFVPIIWYQREHG